MRILISGSTGLLGSSVVESLARQGHSIVRLIRPATGPAKTTGATEPVVRWDPVTGELDSAAAEDMDAVVHLAGESIANGRWNESRKKRLQASRIEATRGLMKSLSKLKRPPRTIVGASAVGYYGSRGNEVLTEASPPGTDFLANLCQQWETETARGIEFGARVVSLRFGIILATRGGALPRMAMPFKLGFGGRIGSGRQWMSWLALAEAVAIIEFALTNSELVGPANSVAPNPVQNSEFTRILAKVLRRPALFPAPAFALRLALGEMADALLLSSQRVVPSKLERTGYRFAHPDLATVLTQIFFGPQVS